jgi:hypothetical protein
MCEEETVFFVLWESTRYVHVTVSISLADFLIPRTSGHLHTIFLLPLQHFSQISVIFVPRSRFSCAVVHMPGKSSLSKLQPRD